MTTFSGRVEARIKVPTGGASVSASNGAQSAASTVTIAAGDYYLTAAGGVSSILTSFQTALNNSVQGYPTTAAAMQSAIGLGTWTSGYLMNESSGNLAAAFGSPSLTPSGTPTYGTAGPVGGIDLAIGFDSATEYFDGGDNFDPASGDLVIAWVAKLTSGANGDIIGKGWGLGAGNPRYLIARESNGITFYITDGVNTYSAACSGHLDLWHVGIAVYDKTNNKMRVGTRSLTGVESLGTNTTTVLGAMNNASSFVVGAAGAYTADLNVKMAALYVGSSATGIPTALSTSLSNFAGAINAGWTAALDTSSGTGRVTVSNSFWPSSISFTSTELRDLLGYVSNFDYPQSSSDTGVWTVHGGWSAGYLCNASSGSLSAVYGTPATLTAVSTPTYSNLGARGGSDKAIGFDSGSDAFSAGDNFDIGATDDMVLAWVGRFTGNSSTGDMFGKIVAPPQWFILHDSGNNRLTLNVNDGVDSVNATTTGGVPTGEFHVGLAVVDRARNKARIGVRGLVSGTDYTGSEADITLVGSLANAGNFRVGDNGVFGADVQFQVSAFYIGTGAGYAGLLSTNMSTCLSNMASMMKSQTGTCQSSAVWFPDSPLNLDDEPRTAPLMSDQRTTMSPTGNVIGLVGNTFYKHTNINWPVVPIERYRAASAAYVNGSLEEFWAATQLGQGSSWFSVCSPLQIYYDQAGVQTAIGSDESISGWTVVGGGAVKEIARKAQPPWTGLWSVTLPQIVSEG